MDYKNINDYEQLYLIKENDDCAKDIVFKKYQPIIISFAKKYYQTYLSKGIDLNDLIQEGNIGLSNAIKYYKQDSVACFYTFCCVCIERRMKYYCRQFIREQHEILNNSYSLDDLINNNPRYQMFIKEENSLYNPEASCFNTCDYVEMIHFKNELNTTQSFIFELRFNGFKYKEIANLLNLSVSTVDTSLCRIRQKLSQYFK